MSASIDIKFDGGDSIDDACLEAVAMARRLLCRVNFDFNGVHVMCWQTTDPVELKAAFWRAMNSSHSYKIASA